MNRTVIPSTSHRRPRLESAAQRCGARIARRRNRGIARSTATRALVVRSGGFGSTERHLAGRSEARRIEHVRSEWSVVAASPGPPG